MSSVLLHQRTESWSTCVFVLAQSQFRVWFIEKIYAFARRDVEFCAAIRAYDGAVAFNALPTQGTFAMRASVINDCHVFIVGGLEDAHLAIFQVDRFDYQSRNRVSKAQGDPVRLRYLRNKGW